LSHPTEFLYWRDLAPKYGFADTKEPPSPIMAALDQLEGLGFITIEVDEGTVYRITTAGINEVEDSLPADLVGQLYDPFDTQDPAGTIPAVVSKWISDKGLA
jgi:DNA-binding PadR family transcriptional regulator